MHSLNPQSSLIYGTTGLVVVVVVDAAASAAVASVFPVDLTINPAARSA